MMATKTEKTRHRKVSSGRADCAGQKEVPKYPRFSEFSLSPVIDPCNFAVLIVAAVDDGTDH
jgi:hypothetical protein